MITSNDIGPIARKIIAAGRKQQRQQVIDLQAVRGARDEMRRIIDQAIPSSDAGDQYPGFAAYVYVTNWALGIVEAGQDVRELWRRAEKLAVKTRPVEIEWPDDWPVEWILSEVEADAVRDDIPSDLDDFNSNPSSC